MARRCGLVNLTVEAGAVEVPEERRQSQRLGAIVDLSYNRVVESTLDSLKRIHFVRVELGPRIRETVRAVVGYAFEHTDARTMGLGDPREMINLEWLDRAQRGLWLESNFSRRRLRDSRPNLRNRCVARYAHFEAGFRFSNALAVPCPERGC